MTHRSLSTPTSGLRVFSASLLSALMIMMPFVQMAAATRANARVSGVRSPETGRSEAKAAAENVVVDPALPGPVAVPLVPSITATMTDTLINDDGDSKADPTNGVPATTEKIRYTVTISNAGGATDATNVIYTNTIDSHTELVAGSITTQPIAVNDSFNVLGNVRIQVPDGASDLMGNDCDPDPAGGPCTNAGLTASGPTTGPTNGQATVNADGSFSYNPNPGYTGADSFTYTVTDATGKTDTATVNLTISGMVWFVDDSVAGGGDGRLTSPFNCLTGAGCFNLVAADDPGDNIFLYSGTYNNTSVFALLDTQKLIGQGSSSGTTLAAIAGVTVPTHSDALPALNNDPSTVLITSTAAGIQLEQDNTLRGFTVGNTTGTGSNYDIQNTTTQTVGTLNISEVVLNGTGGLFRADSGGALSVTFNSAASSDAGANGIQISNATGSFTVNGAGAISGVDGADVLISGGSATIAISSSISNTLGRAVDVQARSGNPIGGITFSGAITDTGGQGIFLDNNDLGGGTGAVTFSGGLTLNPAINNTAFTATNGGIVNVSGTNNITATGTGLGINWNGDTSASTVTFNNVTSATGAAVQIQNSGATDFTFNDVTSTTGTAVDINTATGDFIFHAITKNGGTTGIDVDSATGSFTVNGTGTTGGSGGTIQNTTSHGAKFIGSNNITLKNMNLTSNAQTQSNTNINCGNNLVAGNTTLCTANLYLSSVTTISLTNLSISGSTQEGIAGTSVSALTLANSTIENNGNEDYENGLLFKNLTGTVSITNTNIRNNFSRQAHIFNDGASALTLNVTGTLFGRTVAPLVSSQQGLLMELQGTSSTNVDVGTSSFNNNGNGNGFQVNAASSATVGTVGTHSSIHNSTSMTNNAAHVFVNTSGSAVMYFDTMNNAVMTAAVLQSIDYFANGGSLTGIIQGNTIGTNGVAASGCATALGGCDGMTIDKALTGNLSLRIEGNTIQQINTNGIALGGANSGGSINASIINNTIRQPSNSAPANSQGNAIYLNMGTVNPSAFTACLNVTGNSISDTASKTWDINGSFAAIYVRARNTATVRIPGAAAGTAAAADTHITNNNTFTNNFGYNPVLTEAIGGGTFANGAACSVPLLLADGGVDAISFLSALTDLATNASSDRQNLGTVSSLNQAQLDAIVAAATQRWMATGLTQQQIAAMRELRFELGDLGSSYLGEASGNRIVVDRNAQGKGWFVDATPADDMEFGTISSATRRYTNPLTSAAGRIDLLTAIEHEIGHRLGLDDSYSVKDRDSIMYGYLTMGERRVPAQGQAMNARPGSLMGTHYLKLKEEEAEGSKQKAVSRNNHAATSRAVTATMSGETITIIIGTLRPGDSVTITYDVTVNNPPDLNNPVNPLVVTPPAVATQGSVSYNDGATPQTPVLTDDTTVVGSSNPTETPVDLFEVSNTLTSDLNPSNSGDLVTFTATLAETPDQPSIAPTGTVDFIDTSNGNAVICNDVALTGLVATCQTSTLTAGTHNIRADYSGDGNFDTKQSNIVAQVVIPCVTNPVVDIVADEDDADCISGDCSLREAIKTVCSGTTITFDTAGAFATPQTITLTLGELSVTRTATLDAPDAAGQHVTVSGGNASRVFNIASGKTFNIKELTITGGSAGSNGAVRTDGGTVNLINSTVSGNLGGGVFVDATGVVGVSQSTISGNSAAGGGAGIYCDNGSTLYMTNSTVSGNTTPLSGGGITALNGCIVTSVNVTISNNTADNDNNGSGAGGGIFNGSGTVGLYNTIVAGNFNEDGVTDGRDDVNGALFASSSFNLIGDGTGMTGITHGANGNQVGTGVSPINALLGALADNGGLTFTHALLTGSPAIEAGSNTNASNEGLTTDQRGTGFPRIADSADADTTATVDIGAFELHPSVEDITDKTTTEDTAVPQITFNLGDGTGALISTVTATSGNTTLVPNANLVIGGSGSTRTLDITPAADANSPADGTATITVTVTATNGQTAVDTFVVTVTEVNDAPVPTNDTISDVAEDSSTYVIPFATLLANDTNKGAANESGQTVNITNVSAPTGGTVVINGTNVEFTPTANFFGAAGFTYTVTDDGTTNALSDAQTGNATVSFNVTAVNDPPSFTKGADQTVDEDAG
ncbi:MAG TPA: Ig-like domain-containing protein, partial [Pyrinomonadaceae bacterium]